MRQLPWKPLALVSALSIVGALGAQGCGSDESNAPVDNADASDVTTGSDGFDQGDGPEFGDGGANDGNNACLINGQTCAKASDCCSASCDQNTKLCVNPVGVCKAAGVACATPVECCTYVCQNNQCGAKLCTSDNQACSVDSECCGGKCTGGDGGTKTCTPLNPSCHTAGNACTQNGECCSKDCKNGVCQGQPSFCTQIGDVCVTDFECCTGTCNKQGGATLGVCANVPSAPGATQCTVAGQLCGAGAAGSDGGLPTCGGECCSRSCAPWSTGVLVCQPPSGCRPTGEICRTDSDCCGFGGVQGQTGVGTCAKANPSQPFGRCDNGNACRPAGAVCKLKTTSCNAEVDCCAGNSQVSNPPTCVQDLLGIPRCVYKGGECDGGAGSRLNQPCATSADCCGSSCVPNPAFDGGAGDAGPSPFVCGATCVPKAGACTSSADCCLGVPCAIPPGGSAGICGGLVTDGGTVIYPDGGGTSGDGGSSGDSGSMPVCGLAGQQCQASADCCAPLTCNLLTGRCESFIR